MKTTHTMAILYAALLTAYPLANAQDITVTLDEALSQQVKPIPKVGDLGKPVLPYSGVAGPQVSVHETPAPETPRQQVAVPPKPHAKSAAVAEMTARQPVQQKPAVTAGQYNVEVDESDSATDERQLTPKTKAAVENGQYSQ